VTSNDADQSIGVDTSNPHRGSYSLHVHVNSLSNGVYIQSYVKTPWTYGSNPAYIRAFYSLSALPGPDDLGTLTLISSANTESVTGGIGYAFNGAIIDGVDNTFMNQQDYKNTSSVTMPIGTSKWLCIELMVDTSNPTGQFMVWDDGTTNPDKSLTGIAPMQSLLSAIFGLQMTAPSSPPASNAIDFYVDDIAIDSKFIDCGQ
jgi:hypothetical protein